MVAAVNEMVRFIDPRYGTNEEFASAVRQFDGKAVRRNLLQRFPSPQATESRALAGDDSALEAAYHAVTDVVPSSAFHLQDFLWRLRIVQIGRNLRGEPPLGERGLNERKTWFARYGKHHGVFQARRVYPLGDAFRHRVFGPSTWSGLS